MISYFWHFLVGISNFEVRGALVVFNIVVFPPHARMFARRLQIANVFSSTGVE